MNNDFTKENFVDYHDIDVNEGFDNFLSINDGDRCSCSNWFYYAKNDKIIPINSSLNSKDASSRLKELEEELKEAKDENLKLRIENAYLKELRRLRLEEEKKRKKHE